MIDNWRSYRLEDFIPFTPEVYYRLIERVNEAWWPAQLLAIAVGMAALILVLRGNFRLGLVLLAPAWVFCGIVYHLQYYAEINVAATWFGYMFITQGALLLVLATTMGKLDASSRPGRWRSSIGVTITLVGLLVWPLISPLRGAGWGQAEIFALHPDPTALVTIGLIMLCLSGFKAALAAVAPVIWVLINALTLIAMTH